MQHAFRFKDTEEVAVPALSPKVDYDPPADPLRWNGIILVGEAPGADEVRQGHPFVGRSGQLLDKILAKASIARKECLVANVFRFQPPGNKVDHFFLSRRAAKQQGIALAEEYGPFGSAFCRAEFASELAHLQKTIEDYRKRREKIILIALGRTPLWALTGANGLLEKIGKPLPCRLAPSLTVIPTFHPSFILRGNWARQDEWLAHLVSARQYIT
jgi:DNA polymerase